MTTMTFLHHLPVPLSLNLETPKPYPNMSQGHDGKYFAECNEASISVRETDTFQLIKAPPAQTYTVIGGQRGR